MIEKLNIKYLNYDDCVNIKPKEFDKLQDKINEIIDHLPQEKEPKYCPICKWCVLPETVFCPNCKEDLRKQPTKEVPDMRGILPKRKKCPYHRKHNENCVECKIAKLFGQVIQEISALYRKEMKCQ